MGCNIFIGRIKSIGQGNIIKLLTEHKGNISDNTNEDSSNLCDISDYFDKDSSEVCNQFLDWMKSKEK